MRRRTMRRARRWLFVVHRWIGIGTCLLFAMWFVSGLVMMYVAFPQLTDIERLAALPPIAWDKVQVSPDRATETAGFSRYPRDLRLAMLSDEPVYRLLGWDGERKTVSAVDGRIVEHVTPEQALAVARLALLAGRILATGYSRQVEEERKLWISRLRGSDEVVAACKKHIHPKQGSISADGKFSWIEMECLGACVNAPMIIIDKDPYEDLDGPKVENILAAIRRGEAPKPGPQVARRSSEPEGGATTLNEVGS